MLGVNTVKIRSKPCLNHVYTLTTVPRSCLSLSGLGRIMSKLEWVMQNHVYCT